MIHELCIFRPCFYILVEILIVHVLLHMWLMNDCRKSPSKMFHHVFEWRSTICRIFCEVFLEMKVFRKEWIEIYRGRIWDDKMNFFMIVDWDSIGSASRSQCSFCLSHHFMEKLIYFDKICQQHLEDIGGLWYTSARQEFWLMYWVIEPEILVVKDCLTSVVIDWLIPAMPVYCCYPCHGYRSTWIILHQNNS